MYVSTSDHITKQMADGVAFAKKLLLILIVTYPSIENSGVQIIYVLTARRESLYSWCAHSI